MGLSVMTSDPAEFAALSRLEVLRELHKSSEAKRSSAAISLTRLTESFRLARLSRQARALGVEDFAISHAISPVSSNPLAIKRGA